tara:strand:+ start:898 stop:1044 length:147 start_codon:yes stop_codon:yes gene_type:complete
MTKLEELKAAWLAAEAAWADDALDADAAADAAWYAYVSELKKQENFDD